MLIVTAHSRSIYVCPKIRFNVIILFNVAWPISFEKFHNSMHFQLYKEKYTYLNTNAYIFNNKRPRKVH